MGDHILSASTAIILVEPSHPGNIGAVARAMGNMGATDLRLVNPANPLHPEAIDRATRAESILRQARTFENLETAIADLERVYGTTARERARHDRVIALPELMEEWPTGSGKVGLVFGRESSGLTNQELDLCSRLMRIPTFGEVSSLNLSHAVMVSLYEFSAWRNPCGKIQVFRPFGRCRCHSGLAPTPQGVHSTNRISSASPGNRDHGAVFQFFCQGQSHGTGDSNVARRFSPYGPQAGRPA